MESKRPTDTSAKLLEETLKKFPTVNTYWQYLMFGKPQNQDGESGYYSTGTVDFTKDFSTFASNEGEVQGLSAAFAYQLFHTYKDLLATGALGKEEIFRVLEPGAGNGMSCFYILETI